MKWWIIVVIIGLAAAYYYNFLSIGNKIDELIKFQGQPEEVLRCKENAKEKIATEKLRSPFSFEERIRDIKTFYSIEDAEDYSRKVELLSYDICKPETPLKKIIGLVYEIKYSPPAEVMGMRIEKAISVIFCDESGNLLKRGLVC